MTDTLHRIWVVEMLAESGKWLPCCGVGITREQARQEHQRFQEENPADRFRVKEYVRYKTRAR